ncbi:hexitol phosphatase HxpB [Volucribacter amazonae]|uniref:Phosphatase n=1 Tax=Volucribacter amazonae TaxID=256731 RepID=A0A9X4PBJ4_9PAST|nr:hexitol phosphatase HxpB [Volucribacter amazonae]MDG6896120.1 phosphatase [Volucribacter amazonae]
MKSAVIFDMDGVLIDSEPLWQQSGVAVLNQYQVPVTLADMQTWTGMPANVIVQTACHKYAISLDQKAVTQAMLDYAIQLIITQKPLMPAVKSTLAFLAEQGLRMAIASASPRYMLEGIVQSCGIADYFDYISSADELPFNKPHPMVYLQACEKLGVMPQQAIGIEDSKVGMIAVKAASMSCIVIPAQNAFEQPYWALADKKLHSLSEINQSLLQQLDV